MNYYYSQSQSLSTATSIFVLLFILHFVSLLIHYNIAVSGISFFIFIGFLLHFIPSNLQVASSHLKCSSASAFFVFLCSKSFFEVIKFRSANFEVIYYFVFYFMKDYLSS